MRLAIFVAAAVLITATVLTGCNSREKTAIAKAPSPQPNQSANQPADDHVRRITPEELKAEMTRGDVVIIDVRNDAAYKAGHIKGARLIPSTEILSHIEELPRDKMIVTYCS